MSTLNILYDYLCWSQIKLFMQVEVTWEKVEIFTSFTHIIFHFRDLKEKKLITRIWYKLTTQLAIISPYITSGVALFIIYDENIKWQL